VWVQADLSDSRALELALAGTTRLFLLSGNEPGFGKIQIDVLYAAEQLGVGPEECAYVGDSPFDIRAAKAAKMHAVAVTWGGIHDRAKLEAEDPDAIVDNAEQLLAVL
jgi:uncharacterized protein YbjT (DUF2867 family)